MHFPFILNLKLSFDVLTIKVGNLLGLFETSLMRKFVVLAFSFTLASPAWSDALGSEAASGRNIFSPPAGASEPVPVYTGNGKDRSDLIERMSGDIPNWQQIKMIPSLTRDQRRTMKALYDELKQDVQTTVANKGKGGGAKLGQIKQKRLAVWQKVQSLMSPQQLEEFEQMKQGKLVPPAEANQASLQRLVRGQAQ
jgi:hypothetical protein